LDIDSKLNNFLKITGILNNVFRPQNPLNKTTIKLYNTLALPVLLYGSETWTVRARDDRRITAAEMKCMRRTTGCTWDRLQNKWANCKGVKARDDRRITAAEMKYMRRTAGCTWTDYRTNGQIAKELKQGMTEE